MNVHGMLNEGGSVFVTLFHDVKHADDKVKFVSYVGLMFTNFLEVLGLSLENVEFRESTALSCWSAVCWD
jgi:hypothetical protein